MSDPHSDESLVRPIKDIASGSEGADSQGGIGKIEPNQTQHRPKTNPQNEQVSRDTIKPTMRNAICDGAPYCAIQRLRAQALAMK